MPKIATIGFFDGIHKGHKFLFRQLDTIAKERGLQPFIVTFAEHPRQVLQADYIPQLLTLPEDRYALLSAYGEVKMLSFSAIRDLTAKQFMEYLRDEYEVSVLLMGYDHRFGSDRLKRPHEYRQIGAQVGIEVLTMSEYTEGEWHVSSTEIRSALENGNIAVANELLGRLYTLKGTVIHGKGLGHQLGFPTANIDLNGTQLIIPQAGVYAALVHAHAIEWLPAFVNIDANRLIEVYIPDFQGDLYGEQLEIRFERFIRDEKRFDSLEALRLQIKADVDSIRHQA